MLRRNGAELKKAELSMTESPALVGFARLGPNRRLPRRALREFWA